MVYSNLYCLCNGAPEKFGPRAPRSLNLALKAEVATNSLEQKSM